MKAVNLKSGKRVNFWQISQTNPQPDWIQHEFSNGKLAWKDATALSFGADEANFAVGDVLITDDDNASDKKLVDLSASKFSKDYQLV